MCQVLVLTIYQYTIKHTPIVKNISAKLNTGHRHTHKKSLTPQYISLSYRFHTAPEMIHRAAVRLIRLRYISYHKYHITKTDTIAAISACKGNENEIPVLSTFGRYGIYHRL